MPRQYTNPYGHGAAPRGVGAGGKPEYPRPSLSGMTEAQVAYVHQLEAKLSKMQSDEGWRQSADWARRSGGTL